MPLDRFVKRFLDMTAMGGMPDTSALSADDMRAAMVRFARVMDAKNVQTGSVEDRVLDGPGGPLAIRVYTPTDAGEGPLPAIVYFHGGMAVFCGIETHDGLCRLLAASSGCRIISVDYRLAPEHPFPAGVDDAHFAYSWIRENSSNFGIDANRIAVGGDSAGATLATVVCHLARDAGEAQPVLQLLFCPVVDLAEESESRHVFGTGYFIDRNILEWAKQQYCPPGTDLYDPRISPLRAKRFEGLAAAHIHTAEFDPMRDEGAAYAAALIKAGVGVTYLCHAGLIHHFYGLAGAIPAAKRAVEDAGAAVRPVLHRP